MPAAKASLTPKSRTVDWALVDSCAKHLEALHGGSITTQEDAASHLLDEVFPLLSSWIAPESATPEQLLSLFRLSQAMAVLTAGNSQVSRDKALPIRAESDVSKQSNIKEECHSSHASNMDAKKVCYAKFVFQQLQTDPNSTGKIWGRAQVATYRGQFIKGDTLDEIFCSRWNLPPPKVIISVTGSASDWAKADASEEVASVRFIKNCIYASAIDAKCCWIIDGGSNSGIMRLLGDARRQLGGWGDYVRFGTAQVALIGVGVASKMKYYGTSLKTMTSNAFQEASTPTVTLQYQPGVFEPSKEETRFEDNTFFVPDPSHSHLLYLGADGGAYGDEVKQRTEAELHFSAKFKAPLIYVVLGGGPVTVRLVQDSIQKGAFCVIVKGSGRAADVIAELAQNRDIYPESDGRSPLFWKLHGEEINGKKDKGQAAHKDESSRSYRLQDCRARYLNIVNSKFVAIFDPDNESYQEMCSIMNKVIYTPPRNMFSPVTLDKLRHLRHISIFDPIAKNFGFEVKGFFVGPPRILPQQAISAFFHTSKNDDGVKFLSESASSSFTDMFVSMMRRYSAHPTNAPDVFVTLLVSQEDPTDHDDTPCVSSLIEGIGAASQSCLIWSFVTLHSSVSANIMRHFLDLRMALKVSLDSSVIAFSDSNLQQSAIFDHEMKTVLQKALNDCSLTEGISVAMPANFIEMQKERRLLCGVDEVFFAANDAIGEVYHSQYCLKQHVALRLQAESYIKNFHHASGVYAVCGGDFKQCMGDLQWCCSQRCHLLIFADSGGLCTSLIQAVALHKSVLSITNQILQLCWTVAGDLPVWQSPRVCSIESAIAMCKRALDRIGQSNQKSDANSDESPWTKLRNIVRQLIPLSLQVHDTIEGQYPGRAYQPADRLMRRKSVQVMHAQKFFASHRVHHEAELPDAANAGSSLDSGVKVAGAVAEEHWLITKGLQLIHEFSIAHQENSTGQNEGSLMQPHNPYDLWQTDTVERSNEKRTMRRRSKNAKSQSSFDLAVRHVLSRLKQLQWHTAMLTGLHCTHLTLSPVLFEDSVMAMVNLIENCDVSVVFNDSRMQDGSSNVESKKLVAQVILRRAIYSPSVAMGQPSVDMFGETRLMVVVAMGNKKLVDEVLNEPGVDVHYICRCSSHPTAFGMNALLIAVMLQLPDIAESILKKLLDLMCDPQSTVVLQDHLDNTSKIIKTVDYIQEVNPTLMQDCLSSRHPQNHINTLMFACRWGYAQLLPKFFELIRMQENMKTTFTSEDQTHEVFPTLFERNKQIMLSIPTELLEDNGNQTGGEEVFEARFQSAFRMLLMGDSRSDYGIDINGRSALHHAVSSGSAACVKFCMDHGADALCHNVKYCIRPIGLSAGFESPTFATGEWSDAVEFQDTQNSFSLGTVQPCSIYCGFSVEELRLLHKKGEFNSYKLKMNPELSSAIISTMYMHCFDFVLVRLKELVERDRMSSLISRVPRYIQQRGFTFWTTKCKAAFDIALFSWHIHGILLNRKTVELAHQVHNQSFKRDIIAQQQVRVSLNRNQHLMQGCVDALLGSGRKYDEHKPSVEEGHDIQSSPQESKRERSSEDHSFSSRGCSLVYQYTKNQAYLRTVLPLLLRVGVIALFFVFCNLINAGISPRESRIFAQTHIRNIRNSYIDSSKPDFVKIQTLEHFPEFMTGIEPILSAPEDHPVRRIGSMRLSFLFELQTPCSGLTSGSCSSHYSPLNDGTTFMNPATIALASNEDDIRRVATANFMEFSMSHGARFQNVRDCGYTYCFNALALQLSLSDSPGFNSTWSSLKVLLPQLSSLRFIQLGFLLHSPTIEQILGVRLLFEIQDISDISVHDRFTPFHIAPYTSDQRLWYLERVISILLYVYILHRFIWLARAMSHEWHEAVTLQDGIRSTFRRYVPILLSCSRSTSDDALTRGVLFVEDVTRLQAFKHIFMHYIPKLVHAFVSNIMKFHTIVEFAFCVLGLILLLLSEEIQLFMKDNFNIGSVPQHPALFTNVDMVSPLLDGNSGRSLRWGEVSLELLLSWRRDLMAWALLMLFATLLKHLERLPLLGPKLRAIIAVLRDSVLIVFLGLIFIVSLAYAMSAYVGFSLDTSDKDDIAKSSLEMFFLRAFNQILNIDTQTAFAFTRHGFVPDGSSGLAGLYYIFTAVIGNLVLSNLIITVIGECYSLALQFNPETDWTIELNRFLGKQRVLQKLEDCLIEKLRRENKIGFVSLLKLDDFILTLRLKMPLWCHFISFGMHWLVRRIIYGLALFFEGGWSPYGLQLYPDNEELQLLYESVEIWRLQRDTTADAQ
jgi:hypothetical protein